MTNDKTIAVYLRPFYSSGLHDDWITLFRKNSDVKYENSYLEILETLMQNINFDDSEYKCVMDCYSAVKQHVDISNVNLYDLTPDLTPLYTTLRFMTNAETAMFLKLKYPDFIAVKGELHGS